MKKFLIIFFTGQLLLCSYIFNKSVYAIYELNNIGDISLNSYIISEPTGDNLNKFYETFYNKYIKYDSGQLQIIKTPISQNNITTYDVYHSKYESLNKYQSLFSNKEFNYYKLNKSDFIDSTGVFFTNINEKDLYSICRDIDISIQPYETTKISYAQILKYNSLNFIILLILTQLILFIFTFTHIKVNAIKKMLGYSNIKMIFDIIKEFLKLEFFVLFFTVSLHFIYYASKGIFSFIYFRLLVIFCILVIFINFLLSLITQISLKFIDISSMIKNKVYSQNLNYSLHIIKIVLLFSITLSVSFFISNYSEYKLKLTNIEKYKQLDGFYTSNGFNSDEFDKARKNPELLESYGYKIKLLYNYYDSQDKLFVVDNKVSNLLSETYLENRDLTKEDILNSFKKNYMILNFRYIDKFMNLKDESNNNINIINNNIPLILVPKKYKNIENEIKSYYIDQYNSLLNYNEMYKININNKKIINDISIIYLDNNQTYEILSDIKSTNTQLKDSIILIDNGNFGSLYYADLLSSSKVFFKLNNREEFEQMIYSQGLNTLINIGTLLTPLISSMNTIEFIMNNSLIFSVLFLITLIFIIYISNYIDIICNRKKLATKHILGHSLLKILKTNIYIDLLLLSMMIVNIFLKFNILIYISIIILDLCTLIYLYNKIIKKDLNKIVKGG